MARSLRAVPASGVIARARASRRFKGYHMIRSIRPLLLVSAAVLVTSCGLGTPGYPTFGEASYRLEGAAANSDGSPPVQTVVYRNGNKMRMETQLVSGRASIVYDDLSGAAFIVTPASTVTPAMAPTPTTTTTTPATTAATTTTTTPTPTVAAVGPAAGTAVRVADADVPKPIEDAWVSLGADNARYVGACTVAGEKGGKWTPKTRGEGVSRVACITDDGIVLEVVEGSAALWQATRVERGEQDAALFGVPAGYQVIDPQAVAQAVGETMQDLNNVAGEPAAPATAPVKAPAPAPAPTTTPKT